MTNIDPQHERELWARFTSGADLAPEERARLAQWIEDTELEDELLDDLHSHRVLHALPQLDATHERFVEQTWARAFAAPAPRRFGGGSIAIAAAAALALLASGWILGRESAQRRRRHRASRRSSGLRHAETP
ncbi:MAG: hypothetical protein IPN34_19345 [Planctomycetes bacterium]|nr:hypothetical protein [Planctomycetota bacterium]